MGNYKTNSSTRSMRCCFRYRIAIFLALFFVVFQVFVAWSFLSLDSEEEKKQRELGIIHREERQADELRTAAFNKNQIRVRPDLRGPKDVPGQLNNKELPSLVIHKDLPKLPSNDRNSPNAKEAYRTKHKGDVGSNANIGENLDKKGGDLNSSTSFKKNSLDIIQNGDKSKLSNEKGVQISHSAHRVSAGAGVKHSIQPVGQTYIKDDGTVAKYVSKCSITDHDSEAFSALSRASTVACKQEIADTVCKMKQGSLYVQSLPSFCKEEDRVLLEIENTDGIDLTTHPTVHIAYVLVLHGRAFRQVRRLIKLLYHTDHFFYIHVDKRSDYLHRELSKLSEHYSNMMMTPWRYATIWGGASLLTVYLRAMKELLEMKDLQWDFIINVSESDFPIKTNDQLVAFLHKYRKHNFLKSHGRKDDNMRFIKKQGLDRTFYECDNHMWRLGDRKLPTGIQFDGGSDWFALNREFCEYVLTTNSTLMTGLKEFFKYSLLPAESFFHTILENSELCSTMIDNNLRITNWKRKLGCQCQYKHIVDWCGCSPNDIKPEDFYKIKNIKPVYFARKFEPAISQQVVNQVDSMLYGPFRLDTPSISYYWQSQFNIEDTVTLPTDGEITLYQSFIRLINKHINKNVKGADCAFTLPDTPRDVSLLFRNDRYQGLIVNVEGSIGTGESRSLETWFAPVKHYQLINIEGPGMRLKSLHVSTNFDAKEQIFRNFASIMGPYDNPTVGTRWNTGSEFSITITWIDPANHIAASFDTTIEKDREELHHQPPFNKPLRPGMWTIKILFQWAVIAQTDFLILPLAIFEGKPLDMMRTPHVNRGPHANDYVGKDFSALRSIFHLGDNTALLKAASERALRTGEDLEKWVDSSVITFWTISGYCINENGLAGNVKNQRKACPPVRLCSQHPWSSYMPDPKTEFMDDNMWRGR